mmetsp:Transcript_49548/g.106022  ORF Transcript_49548/g.106022 Transcript_49548/m.106022 type:complete len:446 (+) Transcript_49548:116-1453(+)
MTFVLKVAFGSDIRRKRFSSASEVTLQAVDAFVRETMGAEGGSGNYVAKYCDDEGDLCTLADHSLEDALQLAAEKQLLRLEISLIGAAAATATPLEEGGQPRGDAGPGHGGQGFEWQGGEWHGGGVKKLFWILGEMYRSSGLLEPETVAALFLQWLPMITQRCIRKMEKIRRMGPELVPKVAPALATFAETLRTTAEVQSFADRFDALRADPSAVDAGLLVVEFCEMLKTLSFDVRSKIVQDLAQVLTPLIQQDLCSPTDGAEHLSAGSGRLVHHGFTCDGCQTSPIEGPRYRCTVCDDYDLCGACFVKKEEIHTEGHDFRSIVCPEGFPAHEKGWGKGADWWGKHCGKGWGKAWGKPGGLKASWDILAGKKAWIMMKQGWPEASEEDAFCTGKGHGKWGKWACKQWPEQEGDWWQSGKAKGKGKGWWKGAGAWAWPEQHEPPEV